MQAEYYINVLKTPSYLIPFPCIYCAVNKKQENYGLLRPSDALKSGIHASVLWKLVVHTVTVLLEKTMLHLKNRV